MLMKNPKNCLNVTDNYGVRVVFHLNTTQGLEEPHTFYMPFEQVNLELRVFVVVVFFQLDNRLHSAFLPNRTSGIF